MELVYLWVEEYKNIHNQMIVCCRVGVSHQLAQVVSDLFCDLDEMVGYSHPTGFYL